jgi:hypothetical protein
MVDIKGILKDQGWKIERESGTAFYFNFAPWVAPKAYLHTVFREADAPVLQEIGDELRLPQSWSDTLSQQNGAILFSGAMSVFGVYAPGTLLNRTDVFEQLPFSILSENRSWPPKDRERYVVIGGYGYDGTRAVMDRQDGSVSAIPRKSETAINRWNNIESWLNEELDRLSKLFEESGKIRTEAGDTLPRRAN